MSKLDVGVFFGGLGALGGYFFGGFDTILQVTLTLVAMDFVIGLLVATAFGKSTKTYNGKVKSEEIYKGLIKKVLTISMIAVGYQLDKFLGTEMVRYGACVGILILEIISLCESWSISGIKYPKVFDKILDVLQQKEQGK